MLSKHPSIYMVKFVLYLYRFAQKQNNIIFALLIYEILNIASI